MDARNLRGLIFIAILVLIVFGAVVSSVGLTAAETNITPTLIVTDRNFLPYVRGLNQGPTVTATPKPPTMTPWATNTPTATATNTPTATATQQSQLVAPLLDDVANDDQDGSFTVSWSAVTAAEYYQLEQKFNSTAWLEIYRGPELSFDRTGLAPGRYCYNVRARGDNKWSEWSGEKCTTVVEVQYLCEFDTIYAGPRKGSDLELLHDGRVFITQTAAGSASIFDPATRSFAPVALPEGGGRYAAVLNDGKVLLTVEGSDPHSMIFDPESGQISRLDNMINCLGVYAIYGSSTLNTFCGDDHGYYYPDLYAAYSEEYSLDVGHRADLASYMIFIGSFRGDTHFLLTDGVIGDDLATENGLSVAAYDLFDFRAAFNPEDMATSAISYDGSKIYLSGGVDWLNVSSVKEAAVVDIAGPAYAFAPIADMQQERAGHAIVAAPGGNVIVLGGSSQWQADGTPRDHLQNIELYVPALDKWYPAGALNVGRTSHQTIQLLNGEIFVFGGTSLPGPGYGYEAPTEIGRCQLK